MSLKQLQAAVVEQQKLQRQQEAEVVKMTKIRQDENNGGDGSVGGGSGDDGDDGKSNTGVADEANESYVPGSSTHASHPFDHTRVADTDDTFPGADRPMREMIFLRSITLYQQHERSLQINPTKHRVGHVLMTEQQRYGQTRDPSTQTRARE